MKKKNQEQSLFYKRKSKKRYVFIALLAVVSVLGLALAASGGTTQASADSDRIPTVTAQTANVGLSTMDGQLDKMAAFSVQGEDGESFGVSLLKNILDTKSLQASPEFSPLVKRSFVEITADGETKKISLLGTALTEEILKKAGIALDDDDILSESPTKILVGGESLKVTRVEVKEEEKIVETDYETVYQDDDSMTEGETKVKQEGKNHIEKETYDVTYHDGEEVERQLKSTEVTQEGQKEIILEGTAPAPSTSGGSSGGSTGDFSYSRAITCRAYAYTASPGARGASGNPAVVGTCAVDPSVIPLGTRLYIEGYGYATANDTGGNIKGNTVDVFMSSTSECYSWGVRTVTVYVLD